MFPSAGKICSSINFKDSIPTASSLTQLPYLYSRSQYYLKNFWLNQYKILLKADRSTKIMEIWVLIENLNILGESIMTDTQVYIALAVALVPGFLALRLATELYK
jgi:photosystem I subunit XII